VAYTRPYPKIPPGIALIFGNAEAAQAIFLRWQERSGRIDRDDGIYLSMVIRNRLNFLARAEKSFLVLCIFALRFCCSWPGILRKM
jgi:hypothetical protein